MAADLRHAKVAWEEAGGLAGPDSRDAPGDGSGAGSGADDDRGRLRRLLQIEENRDDSEGGSPVPLRRCETSREALSGLARELRSCVASGTAVEPLGAAHVRRRRVRGGGWGESFAVRMLPASTGTVVGVEAGGAAGRTHVRVTWQGRSCGACSLPRDAHVRRTHARVTALPEERRCLCDADGRGGGDAPQCDRFRR
jgi:hypothetical protein